MATLAQSAPAGKACHASYITPNDANDALSARKYADAEKLFREMLAKYPDAVAAKAGIVRSLIGENKLPEAIDAANRYAAESPEEPLIQNVLGEAHFRRGEVSEAGAAYLKAVHLDPCQGRAHYNVARFQVLAGNFLTAQRQIDLAHKLSPDDQDVTREWNEEHAKRPTTEEKIATATRAMNGATATDEQKKQAESAIKFWKAQDNGSCTMVEPLEHGKIKLAAIENEGHSVTAMGLDIEFNGKRRRLLVDTGASGLVISKAAAASAGLVTEAETRSGGIGDQGLVKTFYTHVANLKIGGMEFRNCAVEVLEHSENSRQDGLIGVDVFARWLVTLDTPQREIRLDPLPKRPSEETATTAPMSLQTDGVSGTGEDDAGGPHDRYVAPEMDSWTRVYRRGHFLIVPTRVNQLPARLFIMDTGAFSGLLSPALAKEVGNVVEVDTIVRGISGQVNNVYTVDKQVELNFGGVRQPVRGITVIPLGGSARSTGVEISGFLGFTALRELALTIDYRDNLVHLVFDPRHGYHATGDMTY